MSIDKAAATALRKPFPPESVGKLPKGGTLLDYVGHAAVTDRLLTVDPEWSWEPFAIGADGLPALDRNNNLWIRLTICGVTRIGVGDGKSAKECIGDAIRNGAMRFGVALDLWAKENLVEFAQAANRPSAPEPSPAPGVAAPAEPSGDAARLAQDVKASAGESPLLNTRGPLAKRMFAAMGSAGITERADRLAYASATVGRTVGSSSELTDADAEHVIAALADLARAETTGAQA